MGVWVWCGGRGSGALIVLALGTEPMLHRVEELFVGQVLDRLDGLD